MSNDINLKSDLENLYSGFEWNYIGIIDNNKNIIQIPKNSTCVSAIIEQKALDILEKFVKEKYKCEFITSDNTREYPDAALKGGFFKDKIIAIDVKTARKVGNDRISGLTIGSYAGYFIHPNEKKVGCIIPYGNFSEHWIIAFLYKWDSTKNTKDMVSEIECVINLKWKIASKSTGTGTTKHIGSIKSIQKLKEGKGLFDSEDDFLRYWQDKGRSQ